MNKKTEYNNQIIKYLAHYGFNTDRKFHLVCWRERNGYTQKQALVFRHHNWIFKDYVVYMLGNGNIQIHGTGPTLFGINVSINNIFANAIGYANRWSDNPNSREFKYDVKVSA